MTTEAERIAAGLTEAQRRFLEAVYRGRPPGIADRDEDKVRQRCRKLGLVAWCGKPARWQISDLGCAVRSARAHLTNAGGTDA